MRCLRQGTFGRFWIPSEVQLALNCPPMGTKGREWLTLYESAEYLSENTKEKWTEQAICRAILDERLKLVLKLQTSPKSLMEDGLSGYFDVPMEGNAKLYIDYLEHAHHEAAHFLDFIDLEKKSATRIHQGTTWFSLDLEKAKHYSIFPPGTQLGVRLTDLDAFIKNATSR